MSDYFGERFPYTWLSRIGLSRMLTYCGTLVWFWDRHVRKCEQCRRRR
jgi:hypothetical protein